MIKLMVIADDFTGALDTGIQFVKHGISTQVYTTKNFRDIKKIEPDTEVLIIDAESRLMLKEEAYRTVKEIAGWARELGVEIIFKKTDSALRGNIGSELQAVLDIGMQKTLYFIPGYPEINRITRNGVHYISGKCLEESVFAQDPYEPVTHSYIPDIIKDESDVSVTCVNNKESIEQCIKQTPGIVICDIDCREDINNRIDELIQKKQMQLVAGCAALAESIATKLTFEHSKKLEHRKTVGMLVACGSLNKITEQQLDYAQRAGFTRRHLTLRQKLDKEYYSTPEGKKFLKEMAALCCQNKKVIIDSFDQGEDKETYVKEHHITKEIMRSLIPNAYGKIVDELAKNRMDFTVLLTGGETLMGYMKVIGCTQIKPICEIEQGTVVSILENDGFSQQIISKSGGFGSEDVLCKIAKKILKEE